MTKRHEPVFDASTLPNVVYSHRGLVWWGTAGFMVIEGFTLSLCAVTYLYLRKNFVAWPPERTPAPDLLVPSIAMAFLLLTIPLALYVKKRADEYDVRRLRIGILLMSIASLIVIGLRVAEFWSLNTQWNSHAYGSIIWVILGFHLTIVIGDAFDTLGLLYILYFVEPEGKHVVGATDGAVYWLFVVLGWLPLYLLVYWGPRFL